VDALTHIAFAAAVNPSPLTILGAVLPDVPAVRRLKRPSVAYRITHSYWPVLMLAPFYPDLSLGWATHIALDIPTHGETFAPRLLYPLSDWHIPGVGEWEFFNRTYWLGIAVTILAWIVRLLIGFLL